MTFDELEVVVRKKLSMKKNELSEPALKALWCALDADDSNQVMADEFHKFLKLGEIDHSGDAKKKFGGVGGGTGGWRGSVGGYDYNCTTSTSSALRVGGREQRRPTRHLGQ